MGWSVVLYIRRLQVQFLARAHTGVASLIPSQVIHGRQLIDISHSDVKNNNSKFSKEKVSSHPSDAVVGILLTPHTRGPEACGQRPGL